MVDLILNDHKFLSQTRENKAEEKSKELLSLANNFARQGQLTTAFNFYSKAFRLYLSHPPEVLQPLADSLSNSHSRSRSILAHMSKEKHTLFRCFLCKAVLQKPITLSCGHTFCHKCLLNDETWACRLCGATDYTFDYKNCSPTTLLLNLVAKVFPKHCLAEQLREKGKVYMQKMDYLRAIELFTQALKGAPSSHLVLSNRSMAYSCLEQYSLALDDAERVIKMQPTWPKGYYRKACILHEMKNYEEAVTALLDSLAINPYWSRAKEKLLMALHHLVSEDVKREEQLCTSSWSHSLPKRADMPCTFQTEYTPSRGETSDPSLWFRFPKMPDSKKPDFFKGKECQMEMELLGATAASFNDEALEKNCEDLEEDKCCGQSRKQKSHSLPMVFYGQSLSGSIPVHAVSAPNLLQSSYNLRQEINLQDEQKLPEKSVPQNRSSPSCTSQLEQSHNEEPLLCDISCCKPLTQLLRQDDFQCSLCLFILYQPLVTPCGHAFCRECLIRSLDHSPYCPLCKQALTTYLAAHKWAVSECLENIIKSFFPKELERRKRIYEEEMARLACLENNCEIPVFVCTFACPTIRCPLHIFEPRYRLMIRRCLECGSNQFGMVIPTQSGDYSDFGCMLKIKNVQVLDDGRSLLDTVGDRRFKVLERGTKDGYSVAKVIFLKDDPIESSERADLLKLEQEVYQMSKQWLDCLLSENGKKITEHYGPLPIPEEDELDQPNGPSWIWWMITILPIDKKLQVTAMSFTKLYQRLQFIKSAILTIQSKLSS